MAPRLMGGAAFGRAACWCSTSWQRPRPSSRRTIRSASIATCPTVRRCVFIWRSPAEWAHGFLYAYPMRMSDAAARVFTPDYLAQNLPALLPPRPSLHHRVGRRALLHHGQRRPGPRPLLAHRLRRARQHVRRPHRRADQFLARHHGGRVLGLCRRAHRQSDHALVGDRDVAAVVLLSCSRWRR